MHICHLSLVHKRRCAFQVKHEKVNGFSAAGNVSGSAQLCENTECCLAIYKIINGELKVDTLGKKFKMSKSENLTLINKKRSECNLTVLQFSIQKHSHMDKLFFQTSTMFMYYF